MSKEVPTDQSLQQTVVRSTAHSSQLTAPAPPRILVAGIGNMFLGDDGFGVEVAQRLLKRRLPGGTRVVDFGIRGMDMAYELLEDYDALIFIDATQRGDKPGTVYLIEVPTDQNGTLSIDTHGMDPVKVLSFARALGAKSIQTFVVGCEPELVLTEQTFEDVVVGLSEPVQTAVEEAITVVEKLVTDLNRAGTRIAE